MRVSRLGRRTLTVKFVMFPTLATIFSLSTRGFTIGLSNDVINGLGAKHFQAKLLLHQKVIIDGPI